MDTNSIDLLELIGRDTSLKRVAATDGGEYAGPCPFCGGADRFHVWPTPLSGKPHYWCRQCNASGDAIAYIQQRDGVDFRSACATLGLHLLSRFQPFHRRQFNTSGADIKSRIAMPKDLRDDYVALKDEGWQLAARCFVDASRQYLWTPQNANALEYLHGRRLTTEVIYSAQLGFNPESYSDQWGSVEVWLPAGIVIPWEIAGRYWRINIRRPDGHEPKYKQPRGCAPGLYRADAIVPGCIVVMTEGEFDALVIAAAAAVCGSQWKAISVGIGPATGARLLRWFIEVSLARKVLLAFDADEAGENATSVWSRWLGAQSIRLRPTHHDVTDMAKAGEDIALWIETALKSA